jgi:hypothetical protein
MLSTVNANIIHKITCCCCSSHFAFDSKSLDKSAGLVRLASLRNLEDVCWRCLSLDVRGSLRGTPSLIGPSSHSQKHEVSMATKILWLAFADSRTNKPHSSRRWSPAPLSPILVSTCSKRWALWANGSTQRGTKTNPIFRRRRRRFEASKARVR